MLLIIVIIIIIAVISIINIIIGIIMFFININIFIDHLHFHGFVHFMQPATSTGFTAPRLQRYAVATPPSVHAGRSNPRRGAHGA